MSGAEVIALSIWGALKLFGLAGNEISSANPDFQNTMKTYNEIDTNIYNSKLSFYSKLDPNKNTIYLNNSEKNSDQNTNLYSFILIKQIGDGIQILPSGFYIDEESLDKKTECVKLWQEIKNIQKNKQVKLDKIVSKYPNYKEYRDKFVKNAADLYCKDSSCKIPPKIGDDPAIMESPVIIRINELISMNKTIDKISFSSLLFNDKNLFINLFACYLNQVYPSPALTPEEAQSITMKVLEFYQDDRFKDILSSKHLAGIQPEALITPLSGLMNIDKLSEQMQGDLKDFTSISKLIDSTKKSYKSMKDYAGNYSEFMEFQKNINEAKYEVSRTEQIFLKDIIGYQENINIFYESQKILAKKCSIDNLTDECELVGFINDASKHTYYYYDENNDKTIPITPENSLFVKKKLQENIAKINAREKIGNEILEQLQDKYAEYLLINAIISQRNVYKEEMALNEKEKKKLDKLVDEKLLEMPDSDWKLKTLKFTANPYKNILAPAFINPSGISYKDLFTKDIWLNHKGKAFSKIFFSTIIPLNIIPYGLNKEDTKEIKKIIEGLSTLKGSEASFSSKIEEQSKAKYIYTPQVAKEL